METIALLMLVRVANSKKAAKAQRITITNRKDDVVGVGSSKE